MAQSVRGGTGGRRSGATRSRHSLVRGIDFVRHRRVMLQGQKISRQSQVTVGSVPSDQVRAESTERYALSAQEKKHPTASRLAFTFSWQKTNPQMKAAPTQLFSALFSQAQSLLPLCNAGGRRCKPECVAFVPSLLSASCSFASGK